MESKRIYWKSIDSVYNFKKISITFKELNDIFL